MSWQELIDITKEAREIRAEDRAKPIIECPICGQLLDVNDRGVKNCPLGHYRR